MLSGIERMGHPCGAGPWLGVCWEPANIDRPHTVAWCLWGLQVGVCFLDGGDNTDFLFSKFLLLFYFRVSYYVY